MATGIGYKGIMGVGKQTAYSTAVAVTDKIPFNSENLKITKVMIDQNFLMGKAGVLTQQNVFNPGGGTIETMVPYTVLDSAKYISADLLMCAALGRGEFAATSSTSELTPEDDLDMSLTIATSKGEDTSDPWESVGAMVKSMTLSCAAGEYLKASFELAIAKLLIASTTNDVSDLEDLPTSAVTLANFSHLEFLIGDHSGALGAANAVGISSFELTFNNAMTEDQQTTKDHGTSHTLTTQPIQPVRNGFRDVTLKVEIPRFSSQTFMNWKNSNTPLQATATFTSGSDYIRILFPHLIIQEDEIPISDAGALKQVVTMKCLAWVETSDIQFTSTNVNDGEVWIELKNDRTAAMNPAV